MIDFMLAVMFIAIFIVIDNILWFIGQILEQKEKVNLYNALRNLINNSLVKTKKYIGGLYD